MSVPDQVPFTNAVGNGITTTFPFQFLLSSSTDLSVSVDGVVRTDYVVTGLGISAGGAVTFFAAPASGSQIAIQRIVALQRTTDYQYAGDFAARTVNIDFDRIWMALQGIYARVRGSLRAPYPEQVADLPSAAARAGNLLGFNAQGDPVAIVATPQSATALAVALLAAGGAGIIGFNKPGGGTVQQQLDMLYFGIANVRDTQYAGGAKLDGITNDTAAFAAAAASGRNIQFPPGVALVRDRIQLQNGRLMLGAGRTISYFVINNTFNMSATGVVRMGTGESGAQMVDVGFRFTQADQAVRANVTPYPPAIDADGIPRFLIDRIRIEGAYDGIKATGNTGGATIGLIEVGALRKGLAIDGALDFIHGGYWHFWPFGIADKANLMTVYRDNVTIAAELGAADGLSIDSLDSFATKSVVKANASGATPIQIGIFKNDGTGARLEVLGGAVNIGLMYSSKDTNATLPAIDVTGGFCVIGQLFTSSNSTTGVGLTGYDLHTAGTGTLAVLGGRLNFINPTGQMARVDGGLMIIDGVIMDPGQTNFTQPHVVQSGGSLQVTNCKWTKNLGSGIALNFASDNAENRAQNNDFGGVWQYGFPASNALGAYGPNFNTISTDVVGGLVIGLIKTRRLIGTADGSGNATLAHSVNAAQLKVLNAAAFCKGGSGEAKRCNIDYIDGTSVGVTGAVAGSTVRVSIDFTETAQVW